MGTMTKLECLDNPWALMTICDTAQQRHSTAKGSTTRTMSTASSPVKDNNVVSILAHKTVEPPNIPAITGYTNPVDKVVCPCCNCVDRYTCAANNNTIDRTTPINVRNEGFMEKLYKSFGVCAMDSWVALSSSSCWLLLKMQIH